jgi:hypothetical protein
MPINATLTLRAAFALAKGKTFLSKTQGQATKMLQGIIS